MTHVPPVRDINRSPNPGPKNHNAKKAHSDVAIASAMTRCLVLGLRGPDGDVTIWDRTHETVHPHARLTKIWLRKLFLERRNEDGGGSEKGFEVSCANPRTYATPVPTLQGGDQRDAQPRCDLQYNC